jgi:hypothetical protein
VAQERLIGPDSVSFLAAPLENPSPIELYQSIGETVMPPHPLAQGGVLASVPASGGVTRHDSRGHWWIRTGRGPAEPEDTSAFRTMAAVVHNGFGTKVMQMSIDGIVGVVCGGLVCAVIGLGGATFGGRASRLFSYASAVTAEGDGYSPITS